MVRANQTIFPTRRKYSHPRWLALAIHGPWLSQDSGFLRLGPGWCLRCEYLKWNFYEFQARLTPDTPMTGCLEPTRPPASVSGIGLTGRSHPITRLFSPRLLHDSSFKPSNSDDPSFPTLTPLSHLNNDAFLETTPENNPHPFRVSRYVSLSKSGF